MKRVFVSLPTKGKTLEDLREEQEQLLALAAAELQEDVCLVRRCLPGKWDAPLWSLGENLKRMSGAKYVIFGKGWKGSKMCLIERRCALDYGVAVMDPEGVESE